MGCIGCSGCGITAEARSRRGAQGGGCGLPLLSELQVDYRSRSGRSWEWTGALSNCLLLRGQAVFRAARRALRVVAPPGVPPEWADRVTTGVNADLPESTKGGALLLEVQRGVFCMEAPRWGLGGGVFSPARLCVYNKARSKVVPSPNQAPTAALCV
jgi:hypothetical protein